MRVDPPGCQRGWINFRHCKKALLHSFIKNLRSDCVSLWISNYGKQHLQSIIRWAYLCIEEQTRSLYLPIQMVSTGRDVKQNSSQLQTLSSLLRLLSNLFPHHASTFPRRWLCDAVLFRGDRIREVFYESLGPHGSQRFFGFHESSSNDGASLELGSPQLALLTYTFM